jgi:hypothetical protein
MLSKRALQASSACASSAGGKGLEQPPAAGVYPRGMAGPQPESQANPPRAPAGEGGSGPSAPRGEAYGCLTLERRVKDDGRALILYTRVSPGPREPA